MNAFRAFLSSFRHSRVARQTQRVSDASARARYRFRHSMLGEPGIDEAVRLYGVGR
jgi:hypothetical protein